VLGRIAARHALAAFQLSSAHLQGVIYIARQRLTVGTQSGRSLIPPVRVPQHPLPDCEPAPHSFDPLNRGLHCLVRFRSEAAMGRPRHVRSVPKH